MIENILSVPEDKRKRFLNICKKLYLTYFRKYSWVTKASWLVNADKTEFWSVPFFRIVFDLEDFDLYVSIKPVDKSKIIIDEIQKIYEQKGLDSYNAVKKATEVIAMYYLGCQKASKESKLPFEVYIRSKK